MKYGLIGEHLSHSFSPEIHKRIGDYPYVLKELSPEEVGDFMRAKDFCAINVTIPYKKTVIPYLDAISDDAREIGAVNTVVNRNGILYGYNTDFEGMKSLVLRVTGGKPLEGKVLILGTGGTSLTAMAVAKALGADTVLRVSRSEKEGCITYAEAEKHHTDASFIINCTPCGMYPNDCGSPICIDAFQSLTGVADAIYNPLRTVLVRSAKRKGISSEGGLYMLVSQAVIAYGHFFGVEPDPSLTERVYSEILREKENVVLIGMPSSGKSTVGKHLCELLGARFFDTDAEIVKASGMEIPEIFAKYGEEHFRDLETEAVRSLSSGISGSVIATGGGAILREENVDLLRANGVLVFLDRPLDMLIATSDRPLSSDREALTRRYNERYPIYSSVCDLTVPSISDPMSVAEDILATINRKGKQ